MTPATVDTAVTFAVAAAVLHYGHQLADHVLGQTDAQAASKATPGWRGWAADARHVGLYHAVVAVMLLVTVWALRLPVGVWPVVAGLGFSAVTHALIDRRWPVRWVLEHTGSRAFADMRQPLCGMYLADQALHYGCLWVSALLIACL